MNRKFQPDPGSVYSGFGKMLENNKKTRNQDMIEHCYKGNRTKGGSLKILRKRANFGEHCGRELEVETLEWNGLRMLERQ